MKQLTTFSLFIFLIGACQSENKTTAIGANLSSFFDLETYFQEEMMRLNQSAYPLHKQLVVDGTAEKQRLEEVDFQEELALFASLNINRPIWLDKYRVDSIFGQAQNLQALDYTATDEDLKTTKLIVEYDSIGSVQEISIHNQSSSLIMESKQILNYRPDSGYRIETYQKPLFFEDKEIVLTGDWATD